MRKYRSRTRTFISILDILKVANGLNKTQIKFRAYLSSRQMRYYLPKSIQDGLIQFDTNTKLFKIADKGIRFLELDKIMVEHFSKLPDLTT